MTQKPGTARAVAAARAVALASSVACDDAVVVAAGSNVLVHLKPAPVDVRDWLDRLLAELHPSPTLDAKDRDLLRSRLRELTPTVFESSLPTQAIHGDASLSNLLRTDAGLIWNDLEDACVGPVHWDVAG